MASLNGSSTASATFTYNPTTFVQNKTFSFTPTTDADNVTLAEFRFYGWNGGDPGGTMAFDNVATTLDVVSEIPVFWPVLFVIACMLIGKEKRRLQQLLRISFRTVRSRKKVSAQRATLMPCTLEFVRRDGPASFR